VDDETLASLTRGPEHAALIRRAGLASLLALPLVARGETIGVMLLGCAEDRYDDSEIALGQDLADRAALSIANARLYQEAQHANRAKSDFLAVMSHELRTPLNAILGYTDLLAGEVTGPLSDAQKQQLERIDHSSRHLLQLVEEILSFARIGAGREEVHVERVELGALARDVAAMLRPLAQRKGLGFSVRTPDAPLRLETDVSKVRQILLNLLSNAVKFTRTGEIRLEAARDGVDARLTVTDTGIGIEARNLPRIFDPFWQVEQSTRRTAEGTGLGLSVARDLAALLGGSLEVESEPGRGTTFTLVLPERPPA
jgi:signal transduction histidine kinase